MLCFLIVLNTCRVESREMLVVFNLHFFLDIFHFEVQFVRREGFFGGLWRVCLDCYVWYTMYGKKEHVPNLLICVAYFKWSNSMLCLYLTNMLWQEGKTNRLNLDVKSLISNKNILFCCWASIFDEHYDNFCASLDFFNKINVKH